MCSLMTVRTPSFPRFHPNHHFGTDYTQGSWIHGCDSPCAVALTLQIASDSLSQKESGVMIRTHPVSSMALALNHIRTLFNRRKQEPWGILTLYSCTCGSKPTSVPLGPSICAIGTVRVPRCVPASTTTPPCRAKKHNQKALLKEPSVSFFHRRRLQIMIAAPARDNCMLQTD